MQRLIKKKICVIMSVSCFFLLFFILDKLFWSSKSFLTGQCLGKSSCIWVYVWPLEHFIPTVKPVLSGHSERRPKIGFQDRLSLNAGQKYCKMLQYLWPSLSYNLSLRSLFCLFLSGRLKQVILYFSYNIAVVFLFLCPSTKGKGMYCFGADPIRVCCWRGYNTFLCASFFMN